MKATEFNTGEQVVHEEYNDRYFTVKQIDASTDKLLLVGHFTPTCVGNFVQKWKKAADCRPYLDYHKNPNHAVRPPIGLSKRRFNDETRLLEIVAAVRRTIDAHYTIFPEWIEEYNEIVARMKAHGDKVY